MSETELPPFKAGQSFRDPSVLIAASTRAEQQKMYGNWRVRYAMVPQLAPHWVSFGELTSNYDFAMRQSFTNCEPGSEGCDGRLDVRAFADKLDVGKARMQFQGDGARSGYARDYWVLWVDEGFRTAALGAPDGSFAWILDRAPTGGADRIKAAREVLDFNGYDVSQLKVKK